MNSKFIKLYPQLWTPQVGEIVEITEFYENKLIPYYRIGNICIICEIKKYISGNTVYVGDFSQHNRIIFPYEGKCEIGTKKYFKLYDKK